MPPLVGLVLTEAYGGCSVATQTNNSIQIDTRLRIRVGDLHPMYARVAWKKDLDPQLMSLGIEYLE